MCDCHVLLVIVPLWRGFIITTEQELFHVVAEMIPKLKTRQSGKAPSESSSGATGGGGGGGGLWGGRWRRSQWKEEERQTQISVLHYYFVNIISIACMPHKLQLLTWEQYRSKHVTIGQTRLLNSTMEFNSSSVWNCSLYNVRCVGVCEVAI